MLIQSGNSYYVFVEFLFLVFEDFTLVTEGSASKHIIFTSPASLLLVAYTVNTDL